MDAEQLVNLYQQKGMSVNEIARYTGYSEHKVNYWMERPGYLKGVSVMRFH